MKDVNLGESFEKFKSEHFPHNPMKIHWIQDELMKVKGDGILAHVIREGAKNDIITTLKMIMDYEKDNPEVMCEIIGEYLLNEIDDWLTKRGMNRHREGVNDIPDDLFTSNLGSGEYVGLAD